MATAVLQQVGSAVGGPIGGIVGGLIGSYIDNQLIFKQRRPDNPDPNYPELQNTAEGASAIYLIGEECRIRGTVLWMSDVREDGGQTICDLAVALANHRCEAIDRIYAEGFEIYNASGAGTTGQQPGNLSIFHVFTQDFQSQWHYVQTVIQSTPTGFDLTKFRTGVGNGIVMTGWANPENNWGQGALASIKGRALSSKKFADGTTELVVVRDQPTAAPAIDRLTSAEGPTNPNVLPVVEISQTFNSNNSDFVTETTLYRGDPGQIKSPLISAFAVNGKVPAYERTCYATLERFILNQFGARVPEVIGIIKEDANPVTIADAISKLWVHADIQAKHGIGLDTSLLDTSKIVRGYTMLGNRNTANRLEPLMMAYDMWAQVRDGVYHFFHPEDAREWTVPEEHFGWGEAGSQLEPGLRMTVVAESDLPSKVTLQYVDADNGYEDAAVHEHRTRSSVNSEDALVMDMRELVLSESEAREIASRLLWHPWRSRRQVSATLPSKWLTVLENDVIQTTFDGETIRIVVTKVTVGANWLVEIEGYVLEPEGIYDPAESFAPESGAEPAGNDFVADPETLNGVPHMRLDLLDIPAIEESHTGAPHVYAAACAWDRKLTFNGAELQCSPDGGATWLTKASITNEVVCGIVRSSSGMTSTAKKGQWDLENSLEVDILHGSLESKTQGECYAGANLAIIGDEIVNFTGAVLSDTDRYTLSGFLRGRMDTDIAAHNTPGERFVLLSDPNLLALQLEWSSLYATMQWRVIATNADSDQVVGQEFTPQGINMRPWTPVNLAGVLSGADWDLSWEQVSRWPRQSPLSFYGTTDDDQRVYEVIVLDGPGGDAVRTTEVTDTETWTYTEAMQATDHGSAQATIYVQVRRVSARGDKSKAIEETIS